MNGGSQPLTSLGMIFLQVVGKMRPFASLAAQDLRPDIITQNTILTAAVGILSD